MSDASMPHCEICDQPEYACECTELEKMTARFVAAVIPNITGENPSAGQVGKFLREKKTK